MANSFIYVVGQPDIKSGSAQIIQKLGFKAGLLRDPRLNRSYTDTFDRVIDLDFTDIDSELPRLNSMDLNAAGFVCTYENYIISKAKISHHLATASISIKSAQLCTDKALMRQAFTNADPSVSPRFSAINSVTAAEAFASTHGYPLIIKPTGLVKSLLVLRCDNIGELRSNVEYALNSIHKLYSQYRIYDREPQLIIEECMTGDQFSIAAFVDSEGQPYFCDGAVSLITAKDIGIDDNYLYKRELPARINSSLLKELLRVSRTGIQALEMSSSAAHIELMNTPEGVKIIEIGARIGGYRPRMYNQSYGIDLIEQEIQLAIGNPPVTTGKFTQPCAVYELFPTSEGGFNSVQGGPIDQAKLLYYRETAATGDLVGPAKNGHKASVIIIVSDKDPDLFRQLCTQVEGLCVKVTS